MAGGCGGASCGVNLQRIEYSFIIQSIVDLLSDSPVVLCSGFQKKKKEARNTLVLNPCLTVYPVSI